MPRPAAGVLLLFALKQAVGTAGVIGAIMGSRFLQTGAPSMVLLVLLWVGCTTNVTADTRSSGDYKRTLVVTALKRTYRVHLPSSYDHSDRLPVVIALHGGGGNGKKMAKLSGLSRQADESGFIVVYPNAIGRNWNDGRGVEKYRSHREDIDDVGFISTLIDALTVEFNIDRARVYVTGASNGALMANRLACEIADRIAAIAPVIGAMPANIVSNCKPVLPMPVLMINGTEDALVPWSGGYVTFGRKTYGRILSVPESVSFWVRHNGCERRSRTLEHPDVDANDKTRVYSERYEHCRNGASVLLYRIEGGGHTWPQGHKYLPRFLIGRTSQDLDANHVIWDFFNNFRR